MMIPIQVYLKQILEVSLQLLHPLLDVLIWDKSLRLAGEAGQSSSELSLDPGVLVLKFEASSALTVGSSGEWDVETCAEEFELLVQVLDVFVALLDGPCAVSMSQLNGV